MSDSATGENGGLPAWAKDLFGQFLDHQDELARVLHLSMAGISMLRGRVIAIEALGTINKTIEHYEKDLEHAQRERDLAQQEVDNDFPLLHEQATVALWSSLEALVRSFVASWLANKPEAWQASPVKRLKVRVGEYEALKQSDRCLWVTDQLDQEVCGPLRNGVSRFESLLQVFDLDGRVDSELQKTLFELSQVRHVLVHRRGHADRRLLDSCPWLPLSLEDRVKISHDMWQRYNSAVASYVLELIQRVRVAFGLARYERKSSGTSEQNESIDQLSNEGDQA